MVETNTTDKVIQLVKNVPEPAGGVSLPDSDTPRMDAIDSDRFCQTFFTQVKRLQMHDLLSW